ncbi:LysR family transcriptional regulator [Stella humosa]|uniref:LysR family transcriptional regulator n=1 Tax=Stella humosa TaxID=94 RepID=A0A3N1LHW1_9PROT|nr:LysR family transcriptional regulator [Stella humosa]ROP90850.1 LysR family transcriptional regulator [Stella humosa]BBK34801.1 LysR family transcriptional regulator [Stella humosa]
MINYTLAQVMTFLAVAETKSFRLAAERLRVSPPAVSQRIRELEDRLGVRLFHRTTRSVVPTAEGERLGAAALQALDQLHDVALALRDEAALRHGRFVVATLPSMAATILPLAMADFRAGHPGVSIGMIDAHEGRALDAVAHGEAAFGLLARAPPAHQDLLFTPLFRDDSVAVMAVGHPLAGRRKLDLRELVDQALLVPAVGTSVRAMVDGAFARCGLSFVPAYEAMNLTTLLALAETGFGVTFVPRIFAIRLDLSRLKMVPLVGRPMHRDIGIVTPRGRSLSPSAAAFRDFLGRRFARPGRHRAPVPADIQAM